MKYSRYCTLLFFLLCSAFVASGQDSLSVEEIKALKNLATYNTTWNAFLNIWAILGPILAILFTYLGIKNMIEKWAENEITKKASEKLGVDWATVKSLVDAQKKLVEVRKSSPIAIVNKNIGKKKELHDFLTKAGFPEPVSFSLTEFDKTFQNKNFKLVFIDNEDEQLIENEVIEKIIEPNKEAVNFVWYTKTDIKAFKTYQHCVSFVKKKNHLIENLDDFLA